MSLIIYIHNEKKIFEFCFDILVAERHIAFGLISSDFNKT